MKSNLKLLQDRIERLRSLHRQALGAFYVYEQLLNHRINQPEVFDKNIGMNGFRIISDNFVTSEDGTGIVHTAPTFGADDAKAAREADPERICRVAL